MCYLLTLATPLTLSEVRAMLPPGLSAHALTSADALAARPHLPVAQTVVALRVGSCSCDLVRSRATEQREDERHLRERYARLRLPRDRIIRLLEQHRRPGGPMAPSGGWPAALAGFVAEHARNAGPSLYHLRFEPGPAAAPAPPVVRTAAEVRAGPEAWLEEDRPVLVVR